MIIWSDFFNLERDGKLKNLSYLQLNRTEIEKEIPSFSGISPKDPRPDFINLNTTKVIDFSVYGGGMIKIVKLS